MDLYGGLPQSDIYELGEESSKIPSEILESNFVIVGASGFLGKWLSAYLAYMNRESIFRGSITLVTRSPLLVSKELSKFESKTNKVIDSSRISKNLFSHLTSDRTVIIYAATSTAMSGKYINSESTKVVELAQKVVDSLSTELNHFVHLSSGGVYDSNARLLKSIPADQDIQIDSSDQYLHEKIILENWSKSKAKEGLFSVQNPRLFSFYGPGLQLDRHFAIGEFIGKAVAGLPIEVKGNPRNLRSYQYPTDAIIQIIAQCGSLPPQHSQIGSSVVYTVEEVAHLIGKLFNVEVLVESGNGKKIDNYVPGDVPKFGERSLEQGLKTWFEWLKI